MFCFPIRHCRDMNNGSSCEQDKLFPLRFSWMLWRGNEGNGDGCGPGDEGVGRESPPSKHFAKQHSAQCCATRLTF